jgi:hypothetical protein
LWRGPWGYGESFGLAVSCLAGGLISEYLSGPPPYYLLAWPFNLFLACLLVAFCVLAYAFRRSKIIAFLGSGPLAVSIMVTLGFLAIVMGLIPQAEIPYVSPPVKTLGIALGLDHLTSSWPLGILYFLLLISLGVTIAVRLKARKLIFLANHLGLWLLLLAAGLGAVDRAREVMVVAEGGLEWRVQKSDGQILEMPLAIRLDSFDMEEYPAKLAVIDHKSGQPLADSDGQMGFWQIDPLEPHGQLLDYDIDVLEFLPGAVPAGADIFVKAIARATVQAVKLSVKNRLTGATFSGWLSTGESFLPPRPLSLEDNRLLAMTRPEPRRFISKVKVYTQEGLEIESAIEVNKPLKAGSWLIYQRNYDTQAGRSSAWSGFELVRDTWLPMAQAGMILWAAGALGLIIKGRKGRV